MDSKGSEEFPVLVSEGYGTKKGSLCKFMNNSCLLVTHMYSDRQRLERDITDF